MCKHAHAVTHVHSNTHGFSLFDDGEEEPLYLLIVRPVKDKVIRSSVTELEETVTRTHFKQDRRTVQWPDAVG